MKRLLIIPQILCASLFAGVAARAEQAVGPVTLAGHIRPLLEKLCTDCHNPKKAKGELDLLTVLENGKLGEDREVWEKVVELVEAREMPPDDKPQPTEAQREQLLKFIDGQLSSVDCKLENNPGKVTIRRLNKQEYRNTIRDLLHVEYQPEDFPNDEVGYGFDNIADVLSLPPLLMEKFMSAAEEIVGKAIILDAEVKPQITRIKGDKFTSESDWIRALETGELGLYRDGEATVSFEAPAKGEYTFRVRARGELAGTEPPKLALRVAGKDVKVFEISNPERGADYTAQVPLEAGAQKIAVAYLNNYSAEEHPDPKLRGDRNLFVYHVEIVSPPVAKTASLPESHRRLIPQMPEPGREREAAREILSKFVARAYRRPATDAEIERLVGFVDLALREKGGFLEGLQVAIQAVLCSPRFLFRWELDPESMKPGDIRDLSDYEVASRLSYFLWSSLPDEELFAHAERGELRQPAVLEKQVGRMLKDWKARAFVDNFAGQWLQIRNIWEVEIDPEAFPKFNDSLKGAMKEETERFFEAIMKEDRPVTDLLDADFTFLNEKLARYYGIDGVQGEQFQRVTLPADSARGGVLTQGSVLLATSTPTRTSPVIRGKWILEQILGTPPPPPPADVPPLPEQKAALQSASLRQRLEQHRSQAECAGCHALMDPLGFALENFDATGAWRDQDGAFPIDSSGKLRGTDGKKFNGPKQLKGVLKNDKKFVRNLTEKMMTYALGRGLEYYDKCAVLVIANELPKNGNRFTALVSGIVTSDPFLRRKRELAQN